MLKQEGESLEASPEQQENQKYADFLAAQEEYDAILQQITGTLSNTPDREEAEAIVIERYARPLEEAGKKMSAAQKAWLDSMVVVETKEQ